MKKCFLIVSILLLLMTNSVAFADNEVDSTKDAIAILNAIYLTAAETCYEVADEHGGSIIEACAGVSLALDELLEDVDNPDLVSQVKETAVGICMNGYVCGQSHDSSCLSGLKHKINYITIEYLKKADN